MRIVITTPTGNIGSQLVDRLIAKGGEVSVIARYPEKMNRAIQRGARVFQGSHSDPNVVELATRGADVLFWLTPPDLKSNDLRNYYRRFGEAAANAIAKNRIGHVVHLSSTGADLEEGTGPVLGLHDNEKILAEAADNIVQLRPGYFMENTLWQIPSIKQSGNMYTTLNGDTKIPMIATRDIAERASTLLMDLSWSGQQVEGMQGPTQTSYNDVAKALREVLGHNVSHVQITDAQSKQALIEMGASEHVAEMFNDLAASLEAGRIGFRHPPGWKNVTPTSYPEFAKEVFKPAYDES